MNVTECNRNYFETIRLRLYEAVDRLNDQAADNDHERNHVNYGEATAWVIILQDIGHKVDLPVWEDSKKNLRIPYIGIDGKKWIEFEKGKHEQAR